MTASVRLKVLMSLIIGMILIPNVYAQENAAITGTVTEKNGYVVSRTVVELVNTETNQRYTTVSNSAGVYNFPGLRIGHFDLSATARGFKVFKRTGIPLDINDTAKIDIHLEIGDATQTVVVEADALHLEAETSEVSNLIPGKQVVELPINGRNIMSLTTLGMGVSSVMPDYNGVAGLGSNSSISFNGTRPLHNLWLIDGAEAAERGAGGSLTIQISPDAVSEFKTLVSNYRPDYGTASGGIILIAVKSGTQQFHGGAWEFNRNDALDAANYLYKAQHLPTPELRFNIFGGNLGGPLWIPHLYNSRRDKTFFFVNEEWRRVKQGTSAATVSVIPSSDFPATGQPLVFTKPANGVVPVVPATTDPARLALYAMDGLTIGQPFPANTIPMNLIDPNAVLLLNAGIFPRANTSAGTFLNTISIPSNVHEDIVRVDHIFNEKFQLMAHFLRDNAFGYLSTGSYPTSGIYRTIPAYNGVLKLSQVYTPSFFNQTAFNYSRDSSTFSYPPNVPYQQPPGWSATSLFPGNDPLNKLPTIALGAPYNINWTGFYLPYSATGESYQLRDDVTWTKGQHGITFGGGYLHINKLQPAQVAPQGSFSFSTGFSKDPYVNLLLGLGSSYSQLQNQQKSHFLSDTFSLYINDNWRATQRLTLNLGVRYDTLPHTYEKYRLGANFLPDTYDPSMAPQFNADGTLNPAGPGFSVPPDSSTRYYLNGMHLAGVNGFPAGLVANYWATIQPRVGFAFDPFGNGKTVIRGGGGLFYERMENQDIANLITNPPFGFQPSLTNVYFSNPNVSALNGAAATVPYFPAAITALAYNYRVPGTAQFNLGVQRQFASSLIGVVQYVGSTAWDQSNDIPINTLPLNSPHRQGVATSTYTANLARIYPGYGVITQQETGTNSSYHSLQAALRVEHKYGLTGQLAYTYSHEIDIVGTDLLGASDPFNLNYDRGSGTYDRRHIFNANMIYDFPFFEHTEHVALRQALAGWHLSVYAIAQSGVPVITSYTTDVLGLAGGANRPNVIGNVKGPKTYQQYFNTAAFSAPIAPWNGGPNQGFGNAGKDALVGPGRLNFNTALYKTFPFTSRASGPRLSLRLESYNTFNHTQFATVGNIYGSATFGHVTSVLDGRVIQLGAKILF